MIGWRGFLVGVITIVLGLSGGPCLASAATGNNLLDGRVFVVETGKENQKVEGRGVYFFLGGKFLSTFHNTRHGFPPALYTAHRQGDVIRFSVDAQSPTRGSIHWEGTVRGKTLDALYSWRDVPKGYSWHNRPAKFWARSADPGPGLSPGTGGQTSNLLDGRVYLIQTGELGKPPDHEEYLIFWKGRFVATTCVELNFWPATYSAIEVNGNIRFQAEIGSSDRGVMAWKGTAGQQSAEGTAEWRYKSLFWDIDRIYWFRGPSYSVP